jgi:hypothetical protein
MKISNRLIAVLSLFLLQIEGCSMTGSESLLAALLPDSIEGWEILEEDQVYDRESLYEYIDGGAELYLSYGFSKVVNRRYSKAGRPDIIVDLFDMGTSPNAFGVFSHSRETVEDNFGQGSSYTEGLLLFWKDRYYVSILASPETAESREVMFDLARKIEGAIDREGPLPAILTLLPRESLVEESIRYFHHHIWLNSHYYIADQNILHIDENTDAVLAKYGETGERSLLLLVIYQREGDAERAYRDFTVNYLPDLSREPVIQIEDGTWTGCELEGELIILVFDAPTEDRVNRLMKEVQERFRQSD